jgi:hypothetical protein
MLKSIGDDSTTRSARAGRRAACGPVDGAGAAQTRQIVHRTREVVASII